MNRNPRAADVLRNQRRIKCPRCPKEGPAGAMATHVKHCGHDPVARFWSFVDKQEDGCWVWKGAKHRDGYGRANVKKAGKTLIRIAHRIAWEFTYGAIPADRDVCHSCDERLCCNPQHLWLGTHQQNMGDMARKGRAWKGGNKSRAWHEQKRCHDIVDSFK